ncbi:hypothetical protein I6N96_09085 [Enterococcus sp. BWM-S5]|uniref:Uncharacterized protein n=1 Tax=Enterococcus larvae TaxID=2794352 RepID=A0ABS4CJI5_9ENTE|nr:hypothetical protein [Enterococcus larvae]MBP1046437.1 hypothetical protein [Enterococcus larvae]
MEMEWNEIEALSFMVHSDPELKQKLIDAIGERFFELNIEKSASYECRIDDMAENKRIAADSELCAIEKLMDGLNIKDNEIDY